MDLNDYQSPARRFTPKQLALIAGGVILAVAIVVLVVVWIRSRASINRPSLLQQSRATIEQTCTDASDPEACRIEQTKQAAEQNSQSKLCLDLPDADKDGCYWELAVKQQDLKTCGEIKQETYRALCTDEVARDQAIASGTPSRCDMIKDVQQREGCHQALEPKVDSAFEAKVLEANQKQDRNLCDVFEGDQKQDCKERVLIDDPDFDGLATEQEVQVYGTDPRKADTDGDGYNDADEIAAGYNPRGEGKL
ncbi:hypothetical protein HZA85_02570 [Candidatus Uhrbacteria bacterium]|nr:hypothetical protein [Candidatus Uhrbacteria bacterium]